MAQQRQGTANPRLSWERLERGWSCDELCEQLKRSMVQAGEADTGLTGNTVRRWETGARRPEPRFRKHLVLLFGKPASELGLLTTDEMRLRPDGGDRATGDEQPDGGWADAAPMVDDQPVGAFNRTVFLRGMAAAALLPELWRTPASAAAAEEAGRAARLTGPPDAGAVRSYDEITARQTELYWLVPAQVLLPSVIGQVQLGVRLIRGGGTEQVRVRLAGSLARAALLAARLAFFDLQQADLASRCFRICGDAVREAQDHALAAVILAHRAFVPGFAGAATEALPLLDAARAHTRQQTGPLLRSWLHCVHSEISARTGQYELSVRQARQAEDSLTTTGDDPLWMDFYDASRLDGFLGYSQLVAGRTDDALASLNRSLERLDPRAGKQRSVVLLDLATAYATADPDHGLAVATDALDLLGSEPYAAAVGRLPELRRVLSRTGHHHTLDERIAELRPPTVA
jgi:hypothetical protein